MLKIQERQKAVCGNLNRSESILFQKWKDWPLVRILSFNISKQHFTEITTSLGRVNDPIPTDVTYMTMTQKVLDGQKNEEYPLAIDKPKCLMVDELFVEG